MKKSADGVAIKGKTKLACGGPVKMASGGVVRGAGAATKGKKFSKA